MEKKNTPVVKPVINTHIEIEVQGYGCGDDCIEYLSKTSSNCIPSVSAKFTPMW
ncbi:hypothetical protein IMSAGC011_01448 [Lachnospiraceae bacterium]|nr:hypothetical protein IMSAGC011_01448 [Lachnospiraceae bacterium]